MNFWKTSLISACAFLGISSTVLYTSCEQDACLDLKCRNGGSCQDGFCRCPAGYEGSECQHLAATKFTGYFYGDTRCGSEPPYYDSVQVYVQKAPNVIGVVRNNRLKDTLIASVNSDAVSASLANKEDPRLVSITIENLRLTVKVTETVNGTRRDCTFNGTRGN